MPKITKKFVDTIDPPAKGQHFYRDYELQGFAIRVTPGSKTYIVEGRVRGTGINRASRWASTASSRRNLRDDKPSNYLPIWQWGKRSTTGVLNVDKLCCSITGCDPTMGCSCSRTNELGTNGKNSSGGVLLSGIVQAVFRKQNFASAKI